MKPKVIHTYTELLPDCRSVEVKLRIYNKQVNGRLGMYATAELDGEKITAAGDTTDEIQEEMTDRLSKFAKDR